MAVRMLVPSFESTKSAPQWNKVQFLYFFIEEEAGFGKKIQPIQVLALGKSVIYCNSIQM